MKYFKKFLIVGVLAFFGVSFCKADLITKVPRTSYSISANSSHNFTSTDMTCYMHNLSNSSTTSYDIGTGKVVMTQATLYCFTGNVTIYNDRSSSTSIYYYSGINNYFSGYFSGQCPTCPSCPSCPSQYTSLECQTEYSLIPVSSVTENYCTANFDLISPSDCPISSGTGDTQRSALYLNNVQYAGASNIFLNVSDFLDYSTTYIDSGTSFVLDVDGYVADTGYLNDILTVQEYHPNSEDFTTAFVSVLTLGLPYIVVALFVLLIWKLIRKIFKS